MPFPFPGMDPYLEGPEWRSFHTQFSVQLGRQLVPLIRPKYFVWTETVYLLTEPDGPALSTARPHLRVVMTEEAPQVTVGIYDVADRSLVTSIEVLSPTNKDRSGRDDYLAKRRRVIRGTAHLLEIDLLWTGPRMPMQDPIPRTDYCVLLSRADRRPMTEVWPVSLRQPLPAVPVPLLSGDPDVSLDLQRALTAVYDDRAYDLELDYRRPPAVPLPPADAA